MQRLLDRIQTGSAAGVDELLPLVYEELRVLARARLAREWSDDVPQTTSLVHDAYLRLVGERELRWESRTHFFATAGEAMRRILIERARRRHAFKRGGGRRRVTLEDDAAVGQARSADLLALDEALGRLEEGDEAMANVVKLRYFAGLTIPETADALGLSPRTVTRMWTAARAWLYGQMSGEIS